jgi:putative membrane protein
MIGSWHHLVGVALAADSRSIDDEFLQQAMAIAGLSLLASRLSAPQLTVPKLKRFANLEVSEQETVWSVLKSLKGTRTPEDRVETPTDSELEEHLVPLGGNVLTKIRKMEADANLAREYFLLQVDIHQQLLRLQEDYLRLAPNSHWVGPVKLMDAETREHIGLLNEIKTDTDSGKGTPRPGR